MVSCFEDLSNELVYEIFEYLNHFHAYNAFFDLNTRFRYLLTNSNSSIKINLSSVSKAIWKQYNADIIENNMHRITTFRIPDVFIYDCVLSSLEKLLTFNRIQCLILNHIEPKCLENLLHQLISLSQLSSLTITTSEYVRNRNDISRAIFSLRALKYCKLSLPAKNVHDPLPICVHEYSPIEHLIIKDPTYLHQLDSLLSYVPRLRRTSLVLYRNETLIRSALKFIFACKQLTHLSLELSSNIDFFLIEKIVRELFPAIEVLHLTLSWYFDQHYANADNWKQLIILQLPYLRIFDIHYPLPAARSIFSLSGNMLMNQFTTPFWIDRQWSFACQLYKNGSIGDGLFYSTNPYRYSSTDENFHHMYCSAFFYRLEENVTHYMIDK